MSENVLQVLLVEDDDDHAEIVARGLANSSVESMIHRVSDGEAALDYLFRRGAFTDPGVSPGPHVILLDLRLPVVDGIEVLRTIKETPELRNPPVVMLTTSASELDIAGRIGTTPTAIL
jgi:CheY-like chemotaxis protein